MDQAVRFDLEVGVYEEKGGECEAHPSTVHRFASRVSFQPSAEPSLRYLPAIRPCDQSWLPSVLTTELQQPAIRRTRKIAVGRSCVHDHAEKTEVVQRREGCCVRFCKRACGSNQSSIHQPSGPTRSRDYSLAHSPSSANGLTALNNCSSNAILYAVNASISAGRTSQSTIVARSSSSNNAIKALVSVRIISVVKPPVLVFVTAAKDQPRIRGTASPPITGYTPLSSRPPHHAHRFSPYIKLRSIQQRHEPPDRVFGDFGFHAKICEERVSRRSIWMRGGVMGCWEYGLTDDRCRPILFRRGWHGLRRQRSVGDGDRDRGGELARPFLLFRT
ncbi:uncharacterized protein EV422DRAFT_179282 [Fimicolochytrium jonesii]|uniref:uncharacterized protein n=1 Tax=Fimicolochytrium jonesii TaxID=1396493 RepID=UPI0022FE50F9|nr:uncharacterized protein EV422DRAFT_179282 [Fimicolochytrium jonesii]KAI8818313.1 hypothetical protein EV422DRAFT_179282 [Fimicolochytrium jonesii]